MGLSSLLSRGSLLSGELLLSRGSLLSEFIKGNDFFHVTFGRGIFWGSLQLEVYGTLAV